MALDDLRVHLRPRATISHVRTPLSDGADKQGSYRFPLLLMLSFKYVLPKWDCNFAFRAECNGSDTLCWFDHWRMCRVQNGKDVGQRGIRSLKAIRASMVTKTLFARSMNQARHSMEILR
jgi:hypothetical protein